MATESISKISVSNVRGKYIYLSTKFVSLGLEDSAPGLNQSAYVKFPGINILNTLYLLD